MAAYQQQKLTALTVIENLSQNHSPMYFTRSVALKLQDWRLPSRGLDCLIAFGLDHDTTTCDSACKFTPHRIDAIARRNRCAIPILLFVLT